MGRYCSPGELRHLQAEAQPGFLTHDAPFLSVSQQEEHFLDGILWVGLGPHPNILGLLNRWSALVWVPAAALAKLSPTVEAWGLALRTAIGERRLLIVIDDAWRIEEALDFTETQFPEA